MPKSLPPTIVSVPGSITWPLTEYISQLHFTLIFPCCTESILASFFGLIMRNDALERETNKKVGQWNSGPSSSRDRDCRIKDASFTGDENIRKVWSIWSSSYALIIIHERLFRCNLWFWTLLTMGTISIALGKKRNKNESKVKYKKSFLFYILLFLVI